MGSATAAPPARKTVKTLGAAIPRLAAALGVKAVLEDRTWVVTVDPELDPSRKSAPHAFALLCDVARWRRDRAAREVTAYVGNIPGNLCTWEEDAIRWLRLEE